MTIHRARLKTNLRRNGNLGDRWSTNAIEPLMALSAKPDSVESLVDIMPDNEAKTTVTRILEDDKFPFTFDVRNHVTPLGSFPDPGYD